MAGPGPKDIKVMVAEFVCKTCGDGWYGIRSLNLPEKCKKCGTKGCVPSKYRQASEQEAISGKRMTMVAKYKCDRCGEKWKSINSSGNQKPCQKCKKDRGITHMVRPYKYRQAKPEELKPKRKFGFFKCDKCAKEWPSAYTWVGKYQECRNCRNKVYAHSIQPLKPGGGSGPYQKPHQQELCQKCRELGFNCKSYTPSASGDDKEVDFRDGESIISIASNTSTEVADEDRDITPTVSDTEEQADEVLEREVKKLSIY